MDDDRRHMYMKILELVAFIPIIILMPNVYDVGCNAQFLFSFGTYLVILIIITGLLFGAIFGHPISPYIDFYFSLCEFGLCLITGVMILHSYELQREKLRAILIIILGIIFLFDCTLTVIFNYRSYMLNPPPSTLVSRYYPGSKKDFTGYKLSKATVL